MGIANRLLVRPFKAEMIKGDPQGLKTDGRQLTQVHRILAKDSGVNALIEIDSALYGHTFVRST